MTGPVGQVEIIDVEGGQFVAADPDVEGQHDHRELSGSPGGGRGEQRALLGVGQSLRDVELGAHPGCVRGAQTEPVVEHQQRGERGPHRAGRQLGGGQPGGDRAVAGGRVVEGVGVCGRPDGGEPAQVLGEPVEVTLPGARGEVRSASSAVNPASSTGARSLIGTSNSPVCTVTVSSFAVVVRR